MKAIHAFCLAAVMVIGLCAQTIPNLPLPLGAGTAEVWNNEIYYFGGSNNWSGNILYPRIYRFDGAVWSHHDSIPDYDMWDVESVLVGDDAYLISGWPGGANRLRRYAMASGAWQYLAPSPNTQTWGVTAEHRNGEIFLFNSAGQVFAYDIAGDSWQTRTAVNATGTWDLSSILYQEEIYILGFQDSAFYKYTPDSDLWTRLANSPYPLGACAMGIINDSIYCVGGNNNGSSVAVYRSMIVYDIPSDTWVISGGVLSGARHWMATAEYRGGLYVVGGIDSAVQSVDIVEEIIPQGTAVGIGEASGPPPGFALAQNYPNPFNPSTTIAFTLPSAEQVRLEILNARGQIVRVLVGGAVFAAGAHQLRWDGRDTNGTAVASGIYLYRLKAGPSARSGQVFVQTRKMILMK